MKAILKITLLTLLSVTILQGFAFEQVIQSQSTVATLQSKKPLTPGGNTIFLKLNNKRYHNADVSIKFFMPATPRMPYMQTISQAKNTGDGVFTTKVNLSMGGTWQIHIFLQPKEGKKITLKTSVHLN